MLPIVKRMTETFKKARKLVCTFDQTKVSNVTNLVS